MKNNNLLTITQKKFDAKKFNSLAKKVAKIIEEENLQYREEKLKEINEYNFSREFSF